MLCCVFLLSFCLFLVPFRTETPKPERHKAAFNFDAPSYFTLRVSVASLPTLLEQNQINPTHRAKWHRQVKQATYIGRA